MIFMKMIKVKTTSQYKKVHSNDILLTVLEYFLCQQRLMSEAMSAYNFLSDFYDEIRKVCYNNFPSNWFVVINMSRCFTYNLAISEPMNALFCILSMGLLSRILK